MKKPGAAAGEGCGGVVRRGGDGCCVCVVTWVGRLAVAFGRIRSRHGRRTHVTSPCAPRARRRATRRADGSRPAFGSSRRRRQSMHHVWWAVHGFGRARCYRSAAHCVCEKTGGDCARVHSSHTQRPIPRRSTCCHGPQRQEEQHAIHAAPNPPRLPPFPLQDDTEAHAPNGQESQGRPEDEGPLGVLSEKAGAEEAEGVGPHREEEGAAVWGVRACVCVRDELVGGGPLCLHRDGPHSIPHAPTHLSSSSPCNADAKGLPPGPSSADARTARRSPGVVARCVRCERLGQIGDSCVRV